LGMVRTARTRGVSVVGAIPWVRRGFSSANGAVT
jgi:hypothetical protein